MITRFAKVKKVAGVALMTTAMATVGLGLGAGTAQADTPHHFCSPPQMMLCHTIQLHNQFADNFFDGGQRLFGVGEGTRFDHAVDRFFGVK
jgi:hypothetical protein